MKFFHLRSRNLEGSIMPRGGMTLGYEFMDDKTMLITFARCSERDIWNKAKARAICRGRFLKGKYTTVNLPDGYDKYELLINEAKKHENQIQVNREKAGIRHQSIL